MVCFGRRRGASDEPVHRGALALPPHVLLLRNRRAADVSWHALISVNLEAFDCTDASEAI